MNLGVLIAVIIYEVVSIVGVGWFISRKQKHNVGQDGSFALAGRGLSTPHVGITLALTMLGSAHIWGTTENAFSMGSIAVWFGIACTVMMVVITQITGPWVRKIGVTTIPDLFGQLFGGKTRILVACVMGPLIFGCLCLETQCIAVTFQALTGWSYTAGAIVGGIFGILYVLLAGMKEVSWLNMINAVLMYVAMIVALVAMFFCLPEGWNGVEQTIISNGNSWMLDIFGNKNLIIGFAIPSIFTATMFQGVSQMGLQTCIAAKDVKSVKKSIWLAGPVNGLFCIIPALLGIAALALPEFNKFGALLATPMMIVSILPKWVVALIMASFLGALLSTFAMTTLCPATIFAHDLYAGLYKKNATEKQKTLVTRIAIVIIGIAAVVLCNSQPTVVTTINWIFTWAVPLFVMMVIGLTWKRNTVAVVITFFAAWITNMIWTTFGLQSRLGADTIHGVYVTLAVTLIFGIILTAVLPGRQGLFKEIKKEKVAA
jgi:SSS family solute:Na+ symporter